MGVALQLRLPSAPIKPLSHPLVCLEVPAYPFQHCQAFTRWIRHVLIGTLRSKLQECPPQENLSLQLCSSTSCRQAVSTSPSAHRPRWGSWHLAHTVSRLHVLSPSPDRRRFFLRGVGQSLILETMLGPPNDPVQGTHFFFFMSVWPKHIHLQLVLALYLVAKPLQLRLISNDNEIVSMHCQNLRLSCTKLHGDARPTLNPKWTRCDVYSAAQLWAASFVPYRLS